MGHPSSLFRPRWSGRYSLLLLVQCPLALHLLPWSVCVSRPRTGCPPHPSSGLGPPASPHQITLGSSWCLLKHTYSVILFIAFLHSSVSYQVSELAASLSAQAVVPGRSSPPLAILTSVGRNEDRLLGTHRRLSLLDICCVSPYPCTLLSTPRNQHHNPPT